MDKAEKQRHNIQWISIRLVERFMNVLYPIEIPILLRLLPNIGYIVPKKLYRGVAEPGEALAIKGNVELILNQDNKTLGLEGRNIKEIVEGFNELHNFWTEKIDPKPPGITHYIEIGATGIIETNTNPSENFARYWAGYERINNFQKIIGVDVVNFGVRLVNQNLQPNSPEWLDIRIQPQIVSSENHYYVNVVWRTKEIANGIKNVNQLEEIINKMINEIEKK